MRNDTTHRKEDAIESYIRIFKLLYSILVTKISIVFA